MAIVNNWKAEAALFIARYQQKLGDSLLPGEIQTIIDTQCPFKDGVAYMPVPRCETCKHWRPYPPNAMSKPAGDCASITIYFEHGSKPFGTGADFGCVRWEAQ